MSCSTNVPELCFRKNYRWNAILHRQEELMVKYMNNGMGTFSLVYVVKDHLCILGYSTCEMSILKVLKERKAVGRWRLHSGVRCSNAHDGGELMSNFILIACSSRNTIYCSFVSSLFPDPTGLEIQPVYVACWWFWVSCCVLRIAILFHKAAVLFWNHLLLRF